MFKYANVGGIKYYIKKYQLTSAGTSPGSLYESLALRTEGIPTKRGQSSGPCRLCRSLDKTCYVVPTALLVRVQCLRKSLHMAVKGPSIFLSMIPWSYCRYRRRFIILEGQGNEII